MIAGAIDTPAHVTGYRPELRLWASRLPAIVDRTLVLHDTPRRLFGFDPA